MADEPPPPAATITPSYVAFYWKDKTGVISVNQLQYTTSKNSFEYIVKITTVSVTVQY